MRAAAARHRGDRMADEGDLGVAVMDVRAALETTARQTRKLYANGMVLVGELLATGGPFPQRLHLSEPVVSFLRRVPSAPRTVVRRDTGRGRGVAGHPRHRANAARPRKTPATPRPARP
jgi:hypothetical protein